MKTSALPERILVMNAETTGREVPLAGECRTGPRDVLLAVIIALSVAVALVMDMGLECLAHRNLARSSSRSALHGRARAGVAAEAVVPTELTSLTEP